MFESFSQLTLTQFLLGILLVCLCIPSLETQNFFLLHLSLFREYLDLEFADLKSTLPFPYSLEAVIDDFILICIFVGNDFLPHLPDLHINEGALELLFAIYKNILPQAGGYLNEGGVLRVERLQLLLEGLKDFERTKLEQAVTELGGHDVETTAKDSAKRLAKARGRGDLVLTPAQKHVFDQVRVLVESQRPGATSDSSTPTDVVIPPEQASSAEDRKFLQQLTDSLHLKLSMDDYDPETDGTKTTVGMLPSWVDDNSDSDESDDPIAQAESRAAIDRVLKKYAQAKIETTAAAAQEDADRARQARLDASILKTKTKYYKEKMGLNFSDHKAINTLAYRYIEGLQWVLFYYYRGVVSWGWFYDYHYAPRIGDLANVSEMKFDFELGTPFKPFAQLMGVLPPLSKTLVPAALRDLMTNPESPLIDFYPMNFEADLNGKKASWEAVVKIPFIEEQRLLHELEKRDVLLTDEEKRRNTFHPSTAFTYDEGEEHPCYSSLPGVFPDLMHSRAKAEPFHLPPLVVSKLHHDLCTGVHLGVNALPGFPTLQTLPHAAELDFHSVNLFNQDSKNQSMVIRIEDRYAGATTEDVAKATIGQRTFLNWPFLHEALVVAVSDEYFKHQMGTVGGKPGIVANEHSPEGAHEWVRQANRIEHTYSKRFGVVIGKVHVLLHTRPLKGLQLMDDSSYLKKYEHDAKNEVTQALQLSVSKVNREDPRYVERKALPLQREFPYGEHIFFLGKDLYGSPATVVASSKTALALEVRTFVLQAKENEVLARIVQNRTPDKYFPSPTVVRRLRIHPLVLARLTSSMSLQYKEQRVNVGLNLKFEAKSLKVLGYTRKNLRGWEFSEKAVHLIEEYQVAFPELFVALSEQGGKGDQRSAEDIFGEQAPVKVEALKKWIKEKNVRDLEAVPLFAEQLDRETVQTIEGFTERMGWVRAAHASGHTAPAPENGGPGSSSVKTLVIKNIPRQAVLKPSHAAFRLGGQKFSLGDRVVVVQDSGSVPLAAMGVVVGITMSNIDVVFDLPFLGGSNLQGRCRAHCGATVQFHQVLNLSSPQFIADNKSTKSGKTAPSTSHDALTRTLASAPGSNARTAGRNGQASSTYHHDARGNAFSTGPVSKPPSTFTPAKGQTPRILTRPAGQPPQAAIVAGASYSATASGQAQPARIRAQAKASVDPRLAVLNNSNGSSATTVPPLSAQPPRTKPNPSAPTFVPRPSGSVLGAPEAAQAAAPPAGGDFPASGSPGSAPAPAGRGRGRGRGRGQDGGRGGGRGGRGGHSNGHHHSGPNKGPAAPKA